MSDEMSAELTKNGYIGSMVVAVLQPDAEFSTFRSLVLTL